MPGPPEEHEFAPLGAEPGRRRYAVAVDELAGAVVHQVDDWDGGAEFGHVGVECRVVGAAPEPASPVHLVGVEVPAQGAGTDVCGVEAGGQRVRSDRVLDVVPDAVEQQAGLDRVDGESAGQRRGVVELGVAIRTRTLADGADVVGLQRQLRRVLPDHRR